MMQLKKLLTQDVSSSARSLNQAYLSVVPPLANSYMVTPRWQHNLFRAYCSASQDPLQGV